MGTGSRPRGPWRPGRTEVLGHRGARGARPENTVPSFLHAVRAGATGVELDVRLTADGEVVVWHDPVLQPAMARDTVPAVTDDPLYPYVGRRLDRLTYGRLATVDVGSSAPLRGFPGQRPRPGARVPRLGDVLQALGEAAPDAWVLVEVKTDPGDPDAGVPVEALVAAVVDVVRGCAAEERVVLESFDWQAVAVARDLAPDLPRAALAIAGLTFAPESPWLGPIRYEEHQGDLVAAAAALGVQALAPAYAATYGLGADEDGFELFAGADLVDRAHDAGLAVLPWTVNGATDLELVLAAGVDGVITDYPERALGRSGPRDATCLSR